MPSKRGLSDAKARSLEAEPFELERCEALYTLNFNSLCTREGFNRPRVYFLSPANST